MALIVQKFGGSSVSDAAAIQRVARRVVETKRAGHDVVVVVSAMGDTTDELLDLADEVRAGSEVSPREMDILLSAGERISMALLAMAITAQGVEAHSFTGRQAGLKTDTAYGKASIVGVVPERVARAVRQGMVAIVAGFQGINEKSDVTTLGRGGSDTTAVALAAALQADACEIYTDVDGLFTADPRIASAARRVRYITYEETLELAAHGAKILHLRAVEFASRYGVPLHVRSSFSQLDGTWVVDEQSIPAEEKMEEPHISGIAHDRSQGKITVRGVRDTPGTAARLFTVVAAAGVNIDMIVQNTPTGFNERANISFTLPESETATMMRAIEAAQDEIGFTSVEYETNIGKLSLVGTGMRSHPGVSAKLFGALADAGINIDLISTSEIRISVITNIEDLDAAVRAVHTAFELDASENEAVVYGGTGR